jgi:2-desacetyl-2-hydroxyethyl bacteriochlorophyllide A dehydrogenase
MIYFRGPDELPKEAKVPLVDEVRKLDNPVVFFPAPNEVEFESRPVPSPGAGEVLVRTRRTLISTGTEITILSGDFPSDSRWSSYARFPFTAGYSAAGDVVEVGPGVARLRPGDRVASSTPQARFAVADEDSLFAVPDPRVSIDVMPFITLAQTVMNGVRRSGAGWGSSVVVYGAGLLGQLAVRFCRLAGARPVIAVDIAHQRLALLPKDPAVLAVDPSGSDAREVVATATRGRMADVVFEVTGNPSLIPEEFEVMRPQEGRFVVLSSPRSSTNFDFHDLCNRPSHTIIGAHITSHPVVESAETPWTRRRNAEHFFDVVADGELELESLITHRRTWPETCQAYKDLLADRSASLGQVLNWDDDGS